MELAQVVTAGIAVIAIVLSMVNVILMRNDRSGDKYDALQKSMAELTLQFANLRTELAQQEIARQRDLELRFASRESQKEHKEIVEFVQGLVMEVHQRLYPDAVIHQPGARRG